MNVLFDYQAFSSQRAGGVSRYFVELFRQFERMAFRDYDVRAGLYLNAHLKEARASLSRVRGVELPACVGISRLLSLANRAAFGAAMLSSKADIYHATYFNWLRGPRAARRVFTVFDMTAEKHPEFASPGDPTSQRKRFAVEHADALICISHTTRKDLQELWNVPDQKITVISLGLSQLAPEPASGPATPAPYFLFVGQRAGYKNFSILLKAMSAISAADTRLVCFGGGPPKASEKEHMQRLGLAGRVEFTHGTDRELAAWYANAAALVYPSLYEGFGLPLLEAMSAGCPVLSSNRGSLPEVAGDAALFFDPARAEELQVAMTSILSGGDLRKRLIEQGNARARLFSWERCARETLDLYRATCAR